MQDIKDAIINKKLIIGSEKTLKLLRHGSLSLHQVYLSRNCPQSTREDIEHYAKLFNIKVSSLKENNEELGILCKKPFAISVIAV